MPQMIEPRRTGKCGQGSEVSFRGDAFEYTASIPNCQSLQTASVIKRFGLGIALARVVAEHAFARRPQR